jgi:hypothetical protein
MVRWSFRVRGKPGESEGNERGIFDKRNHCADVAVLLDVRTAQTGEVLSLYGRP